MKNSRTITFFNSLRGKAQTDADIYEILIEFISGKDDNYLKYLQENLNLYLIDQKKNLIDNLSQEHINTEIKKRKEKSVPIPKIGTMSGTTSKNKKYISEFKKTKHEDRVDYESFIFPEEFKGLYKTKTILKEIINNRELEKLNNNTKNLINLIDFSDSNGVEKIIVLEELGILEYLKKMEPFNSSTNKMASAISYITGMNATTVQSKLNPIYSTSTLQKNNPLNNKNAVTKVRSKLSNLDFKRQK